MSGTIHVAEGLGWPLIDMETTSGLGWPRADVAQGHTVAIPAPADEEVV